MDLPDTKGFVRPSFVAVLSLGELGSESDCVQSLERDAFAEVVSLGGCPTSNPCK